MIGIAYDDTCDAIWISFHPEPFPPRSLVASRDGEIVTIHRRMGDMALVAARFDAIAIGAGAPFASPETALQALQALFARWPASAGVETVTALTDLGGHRLVRVANLGQVAYASCEDPATASVTLGLTLGAAAAGAPVDVLTRGPLEEPSWTFPPGPAFLGRDGALASAPPAAGLRLQVGTFIAPTRLVLALGPAVLLAT